MPSGMKVHCKVLWLLDKQTLQYAPLSIADRALRLAISEDMAFDGAYCVVVSIAAIGVSEVLFVEPKRLNVDPLCTAFTIDSWKYHSFPKFFCSLVVNEFLLLDVNSCPCSLNRDVAWNARSIKFAFFFPLQYSRIL